MFFFFLFQLSPAFKKNFAIMLKKRAQKHPFERVPTPYQIYSWMLPMPEHTVDYIRAEDGRYTCLAKDSHEISSFNFSDIKSISESLLIRVVLLL